MMRQRSSSAPRCPPIPICCLSILILLILLFRISACSRYQTPARALSGPPLRLVGGYRFLPLWRRDASVVPVPPSSVNPVGAEYRYFPPDCVIDSAENTNIGLLRIEKDWRGKSVVAAGDRLALRVTRRGMFEDPPWQELRRCIAVCQAAFGVNTPIDASTMNAQLIDELKTRWGATDEEIDQGRWWLTLPITTTGLQAAYHLRDARGQRCSPDLRFLVATPLSCARAADSTVASVSEFRKVEVDINLDQRYFGRFDQQGHGLDMGHRFDAYDADHAGERIRIDARIRLRSGDAVNRVLGGHDYQVPCFALKEQRDGNCWKWKLRFAPPRPTTGTEYWEVAFRAVVSHKTPPPPDTIDTECNRKPIPPDGQILAYYHYWGYGPADADPLLFPGGDGGNHHTDPGDMLATDPVKLVAGRHPVYDTDLPLALWRFRCSPDPAAPRPLELAQGAESPFYFYRQQPDGRHPLFILGATRAWGTGFERRRELLEPMHNAGLNFNLTWLAPWECMLVHNSQYPAGHEDWYPDGGVAPNAPNPPPPLADSLGRWQPHAYYDQGRAQRLDRILEDHDRLSIYTALTLWPHDALSPASNSNPGNYRNGPVNLQNGLGSYIASDDMDRFFRISALATPLRPAPLIFNSEWLWQKNLYRYIAARWGYSPTLAFWGIVGEYENVGPGVFYWSAQHALTTDWHDHVLQGFREEWDFRRRPITSWAITTADWHTAADRAFSHPENPGLGDFDGGQQKNDLWAFDAYPAVYDPTGKPDGWRMTNTPDFSVFLQTNLQGHDARLWHYAVARMCNWVRNTALAPSPDAPPPIQKPHLITETGLSERFDLNSPTVLEAQQRSYLHFTAWAALACGHAGAPLKWCDGGTFGEMFPRPSSPRFAPPYPDYSAELTPLAHLLATPWFQSNLPKLRARFTNGADARPNGQGETVSKVNIETDHITPLPLPPSLLTFGLQDSPRSATVGLVWIFDDEFYTHPNQTPRTYLDPPPARYQNVPLTLTDLTPNARYQLRWFNTWTGRELPDRAAILPADPQGRLTFPLAPFPTDPSDLHAKRWTGADVLFTFQQLPPPTITKTHLD